MALLPLAPELAAKFNRTRAWEWYDTVASQQRYGKCFLSNQA